MTLNNELSATPSGCVPEPLATNILYLAIGASPTPETNPSKVERKGQVHEVLGALEEEGRLLGENYERLRKRRLDIPPSSDPSPQETLQMLKNNYEWTSDFKCRIVAVHSLGDDQIILTKDSLIKQATEMLDVIKGWQEDLPGRPLEDNPTMEIINTGMDVVFAEVKGDLCTLLKTRIS